MIFLNFIYKNLLKTLLDLKQNIMKPICELFK